eukprot:3581582-Pleurochrysis_carterae.AAC.2
MARPILGGADIVKHTNRHDAWPTCTKRKYQEVEECPACFAACVSRTSTGRGGRFDQGRRRQEAEESKTERNLRLNHGRPRSLNSTRKASQPQLDTEGLAASTRHT